MKETIKLIENIFITIPFAIILVIAMMLADKINNGFKSIVLYFIGSSLLGATLSEFVIRLINNYIIVLEADGQRVVTAFVTIFGFTTLVYLLKHDLVQKIISDKIKDKIQ